MRFEADYKNSAIAEALKELDEEELEKLLGIKKPLDAGKKKTKASKWSTLVEKNRQDPISLGDYTEQDRKDRTEFRENVSFNHDL